MRVYGSWAGNPKGRQEDITKCISEVWERRTFTSRQCTRDRGNGPDGLYCKQHAKRELEIQQYREAHK